MTQSQNLCGNDPQDARINRLASRLPRVAVAVVTYNNKEAILRLLERLQPLSVPVYVTENAGTDGAREAIRSAHPWVSLLESPANLGGCGGFNCAVLAALGSGSDYVLLIDDDALPLDDCIEQLADFLAAHPDYVFAAPAISIASQPDRLQETGGGVDFTRPRPIEAWNRFAVSPLLPPVLDVDYASACCLMVRSDAILRLGVMDWNFFIFSDDVDWTLRLRRTFSKKGACVTTARALHDFPWAKPFSPLRLYFFQRNAIYLIARHARRPDEHNALLIALRRLYWQWIYSRLIGDWEIATTLARVHRDSRQRRYGAWKDPILFGAGRLELKASWFATRRIRRVLLDITIEDHIPGALEALHARGGEDLVIDLLCDDHRISVHRESGRFDHVRGRISGRLGLLKTFPHIFRRFYDLVVTDSYMDPRRPTSMAGRRAAFYHDGRLLAAANRPVRSLIGSVVAAFMARLLAFATARTFREPPPLGAPPPEAAVLLHQIGVDPAVGQPWARAWPLPFCAPCPDPILPEVPGSAGKVETSGGYDRWLHTRDQVARQCHAIAHHPNRPLFSVLVPVCDPQPQWLLQCMDSVLAQTYGNWELILFDDASSDSRIREILTGAEATDPRIRTGASGTRCGISRSTNAAAALATGEWLLFLDHDDRLDPHALAAFVLALRREDAPEQVDILYADEDRFDDSCAHFHPGFKPNYSPDLLLGTNYMHHPVAIRRSLFARLGGLRSQYDGSQDHDLLLRAVEQGGKVLHIADVLYHMRVHPASLSSGPKAKPMAHARDRALIAAALQRRNPDVESTVIPLDDEGMPGFNRIRYRLHRAPRVSVLRLADRGEAVDPSAWGPHEIISVHPQSQSPGAALNTGISRASGEVLVITSEALQPPSGWEDLLLPQVLREGVGLVGGRLEYADGFLFASGLVLGMAGAAGRWHHGCKAADPGYGGWMVLDHEISALPRQLLVVRREHFLATGGFDELYRRRGYEIDLALRLGRDRGLTHLIINGAHFRLAQDYPRQTPEPWDPEDFVRLWSQWGEVLRRGDPYVNVHASLLDEDVQFVGPREHVLRLRGCFMAYDAPSARLLGKRFERTEQEGRD